MKKYICHYVGGYFDFYADTKELALDHAKHHCDVQKWEFISVTIFKKDV
jgi:hypothetical protein